MDWRWWCVLLSLSVSARGSECPEGAGCNTCIRYPEDIYQMTCATANNEIVTVDMRANDYVQMNCRKSVNWATFNIGSPQIIRGVKKVLFKMCNLPEENGLASITNKLLIKDLQELYFSSYNNLSSKLTNETLKGFNSVKTLSLLSNEFTTLPGSLLEDMTNLTFLDLRYNNLHQLPKDFFTPPKLERLEIGYNKLASLDRNSFGNLSRLKILNIFDNEIANIEPDTFDGLGALERLDLKLNNLESLPAQIFHRLSKLKAINLSRNNFSEGSLPADLLKNCTDLEEFTLEENSRNMTTLPERFFANFMKLGTIELKKIGLTILPENLFQATVNLQNLNLERNFLSTLPSNIFQDNSHILTLDLSFNEISYLPDGIFSNLRDIVRLDLSRNHIATISGNLFSGLSSLQELNMERNNMTDIDLEAFISLQKLKIARFSYNSLTLKSLWGVLGSPFKSSTELEELHLDYNNISDIFDDWMLTMNSLRLLNLSHNSFQIITDGDLQFFSPFVQVDLSYNKIRHINLDKVEIWATDRDDQRNVKVSVENNPIECDCELYSLLRYLEGELHPNVQNAFHLVIGQLKCTGPQDFADIAIIDLKSSTLTCDIKVTRNESDCPSLCTCYSRPFDKAYIINCSNVGLTEPPQSVCTESPHSSIHLNLSGNSLNVMPDSEGCGYDEVTVLDLTHNNISKISVENLPRNLTVLKLNNNGLSRLNQDVIARLENSSKLLDLTLHSNPWDCDCEARQFFNFVQKKSIKLPELMKITCSGRESLPIHQMTPDELCPTSNTWIIVGCSLVALLGLILGTLAAVYYRYQMEIKVWLYAKNLCLWFVTENELDRDKLFDAFISYSHKDEDFVVNDLIPKLEAEPRPFKLCVHFRDWLAGEWIPKQIARSVEESRRTIVVLSPNFLESVWGRMEFRAAHSQALSEGRARVIVILYGDIGPTEELDPELNAYLSMNTYVKWGDPWFWQKLEYAMPHPPGIKKRKSRKSIFESTQPPRIAMPSDKSELINSSGTPSTPPISTTPPADSVKIFIVNGVTDNEYEKPAINNIDRNALPPAITDLNPNKSNSVFNKIQCTTV
ncbi:protein toll-like [Venturia canescens]|uniref:protein toll-like n=1 Tax=Venturia canescens TaxID=32260 RepID=UPI001C9CA862|nr:protein toll-like [Venturia canescens]XP_043273539.1 protein toll-like [Venturia canescens]